MDGDQEMSDFNESTASLTVSELGKVQRLAGISNRMLKNPRMSMVSATLAISDFPVEFQGILSDAYDPDGDGHISTDELVKAAEISIQNRKFNRMLWKGLAVSVFVVLALVGLNAGLTFGIVDANKDTEVHGRALMVRENGEETDKPVATSNNEVTVTLATLPFLPSSAVSHVENLAFSSEDGSVVYHRKVRSVDISPEKSVKLLTTEGDMVKWDLVEDAKKLSIALASGEEGTAWKMGVYCTQCTAANVYSTPDILDGLDRFETATGKDARRHLGHTLSRSLSQTGRTDDADGDSCISYDETLEACCAVAPHPDYCC